MPAGFAELEPVTKDDDCYISNVNTKVFGSHLAGARLIAHSPCKLAGALSISEVPGIRNLWFLDGIESVWGTTLLDGNDELESLEGLESVQRTGMLEIVGNSSLQTLKGLDGLRTVAPPDDPLYTGMEEPGVIRIAGNPSLRSLDGLENLKSAKVVTITNCENLSSIESLYGMKTLEFLTIRNAQVPECQVDELLGRLESTDVEVDLAGLGSGDCS
ncbi:MAG: hypothetical protein ACQEVA_09670 [Myxococcota bacterium]